MAAGIVDAVEGQLHGMAAGIVDAVGGQLHAVEGSWDYGCCGGTTPWQLGLWMLWRDNSKVARIMDAVEGQLHGSWDCGCCGGTTPR